MLLKNEIHEPGKYPKLRFKDGIRGCRDFKKILQGEVDLIVGCRQLNLFRFKTEKFRELLLPIAGIVSETDDFLIGDQRLGSSADFLLRMDKRRDQYLQKVKPIIIEICQEIVNEYKLVNIP